MVGGRDQKCRGSRKKEVKILKRIRQKESQRGETERYNLLPPSLSVFMIILSPLDQRFDNLQHQT